MYECRKTSDGMAEDVSGRKKRTNELLPNRTAAPRSEKSRERSVKWLESAEVVGEIGDPLVRVWPVR